MLLVVFFKNYINNNRNKDNINKINNYIISNANNYIFVKTVVSGIKMIVLNLRTYIKLCPRHY
jgi:hypothetical protein